MTRLAARFRPRSEFRPSTQYRLLPFRFGAVDAERYVVTNDVGEYVLLSRKELVAFVRHELPRESPSFKALEARHFLFDTQSDCAIDLLALKYRTRADRIAAFTGLFIFVVTLRCDHSCHYCQVSRQTEEKAAFDMRAEHVERAIQIVFRTPNQRIKLEFQGGEPLLNFDLVKDIVQRANEINRGYKKDLQFVIASNLTQLNDGVLAFCKEHHIYLSTSLDGPERLHNGRRKLRTGNSHDLTVAGIRRAREVLGPDSVSALMTTTPESLKFPEEIIDEYIRQGFHGIFLRSLSPYGFAQRTSLVNRYDVRGWLDFYRRGLAHILDVNRGGYLLREEYTTILLQKIWSPGGAAFVDLQSPAGIGIAALVFNYDGAVYASDEGRMLAEMGDYSFRLGDLETGSYETIMTSDALLGPLEDTLLESSPRCSDCPFLPYCGADPVYHQASQGDPVGHKVFSSFCERQTGVLTHLIRLLEDDSEARRLMMAWL
jgi:uncharacterized protein